MAEPINFPNGWTRIFSASVHFVGSCVLTFVLARRTAFENLDTFRGWRELGAAKLSVIMAFADSLLFLLLTGILTHGAGLELSHGACSTAFFACVFLYASSKVFIYNFLTERVWVVWSSTWLTTQPNRWKSPLYLLCIGSESLYSVVVTLALLMGITDSGFKCYIGLHVQASLLLLGYDCYMNVLLTALFVYPLWKESDLSKRLRKMAIRTLIAALVALTTSTTNIAVLAYFHGRERGWLCLLCCSTDVAINSLVIYAVTRSRRVRRWKGYQGRVSTKPAQDTYAEEHGPMAAGRGGGDGGDLRIGGIRSIAWTVLDKDKDKRTCSRLQYPRDAISVNGGGLIGEKSQEAASCGDSRISIAVRQRHGLSLTDEEYEACGGGDGDGDVPLRTISLGDLENQGLSVHQRGGNFEDHHDHDEDDEYEVEDEDEDDYEDGRGYIAASAAQQQPKRPREFIVRAPHLQHTIDSAASSSYSLSSGYTTCPDETTASTPGTSAPSATSHTTTSPAALSPPSDTPQPPQIHVSSHPFPPYSVHDTIHADLALATRNSTVGITQSELFSSLPPPSPSHPRPLRPSSSYPPASFHATSSHTNLPQKRMFRSRSGNLGGDRQLLSLTEALVELDLMLTPPGSVVSLGNSVCSACGTDNSHPGFVRTAAPITATATAPNRTRGGGRNGKRLAFGIGRISRPQPKPRAPP